MKERRDNQYKNNDLENKARIIESFLRQLKQQPYTFKKSRSKYRILTDTKNKLSDI